MWKNIKRYKIWFAVSESSKDKRKFDKKRFRLGLWSNIKISIGVGCTSVLTITEEQ